MATQNNTNNNGIGFVGLLTLLFVGCKLFGVINWSWWWVFSPLWIGAAFWLVVLALIIMVAAIAGALK